jgi:hypothetical protein
MPEKDIFKVQFVNLDPDPATQINADPDPKFWISKPVVINS